MKGPYSIIFDLSSSLGGDSDTRVGSMEIQSRVKIFATYLKFPRLKSKRFPKFKMTQYYN